MTPDQVNRIKSVKNPHLKLAIYRAIIRSTATNQPRSKGGTKNGKSEND
jgi:hypothetical protein